MLSPGDVLQERYEIEDMLGKGGFGAVYLARDRRLKRQVALKETLHLDPDILRFFEREAEVLASLEHQSLPGVTDYFLEGQTYYTVMSFIPGQDLGAYLAQQPEHRLGEQETLTIIMPVLEALEYLHSRTPPIIHRDIKPGNIRMTPENRVYLVDFGLAKQFDAQPVSTLSVVALTPSFSPPEQYYQQADTRSDIYALGATIYVMLCGINPTAAHERMSGKELVPIQQHNPAVSPELEAIVTRMLATSPDDRYQTASELHQVIQPLLTRFQEEDASATPAIPAPPADSTPVPAPAPATGATTAVDTQQTTPDAPATSDVQAGMPTQADPDAPAAPDVQAGMPTQAAPDAPAAPAGTDAQASIPTQAAPDNQAAPDTPGKKPNAEAALAFVRNGFDKVCQAPLVQNIAEKLPLPAGAKPMRNQIVVGSGALLALLLLIGLLALLPGGGEDGQPGTIAMSDDIRDQVLNATVKIEAEGSFTYPTDTWSSWIGQGSGVILDDSGLALTSHHVVAGAGTLQILVGEDETPHIARLLGSSECLDLAVIDIEGEDFAEIGWYDGEIETGLAIFTAGYPNGGDVSMSRGLVTEPAAPGDTAWASLDTVIQHDAAINPGSSGGPLVTVQGEIVGINYRSRPHGGDERRSFAIARDDIREVIDQLRNGENVLSIGVNGEVVQGDQVSGVWVYSVESGSAADQTRVRPGDIITHLEGVSLGDEGTLTKYCRVLRSNDPTDVLSMRVVRAATGETFEGQLNGRELELVEDPTVTGPVAIRDPEASTSTENDAEEEVNNLRVVRSSNEVELWVNDVPVGTAPADETSGQRYYVGITGAAGEDTPVTVLFDNLFVWE